jgi:lipopolysaccharide export system protein LptA
MRSFVNIFFVFAAITAAAFDSDVWLFKRRQMTADAMKLKAFYEDCAAKASEPAENVAVPIENHPNGSVKSSVFAKKAQFFLESGLVWGEGVIVRELKDDGTVVAQINAENCVVDRNAKAGWAQGRVKALYDGTVLEGEGVYLNFKKEFVIITDKAKIVSKEFDVSGRGRDAKGKRGKETTSLISRRADYDRSEGVVMFEDGVFLDNPEYKFAAEQLFAFLQGTNELKRVVAIGGVAVTNGSNCGACDRAVYNRAKGRVTMYGRSGGEPARLEELGKKGVKNRLEGDKISFWMNSEQVEVENSRITVDSGGKLKL